MASVSSLTDDIQRALQQAVGDANNAAAAQLTHSGSNGKHQKKSKRQREDDQDHLDEDGGGVKRKKKSKKNDGVGSGETGPAVSATGSGSVSSTSPEQSVAGSSGETTPASGESREHSTLEEIDATSGKKKKKKNKGKERAHEEPTAELQPAPGIPPTATAPSGFPMDLPASSADFLSAVVAAASATAGQQLQGGPPFDHTMQQYMAYPPLEFDPYAYPGPPLPHGHPAGHPPPAPQPHPHAMPPGQPFPGAFGDPAALLHDLNFTSSEDLLRSLQEFDISKVVTVLKTLGEAAAAANVHLNVPPMFMPGPQPGPPLQQPVRSEAILGRPPKQKKNRGAAGQDVAAPVPLQHDNPDHAHMLANVWMSTSKLAELVKTEG